MYSEPGVKIGMETWYMIKNTDLSDEPCVYRIINGYN